MLHRLPGLLPETRVPFKSSAFDLLSTQIVKLLHSLLLKLADPYSSTLLKVETPF